MKERQSRVVRRLSNRTVVVPSDLLKLIAVVKLGVAAPPADGCSAVAGKIKPNAYCDWWKKSKRKKE